MHRGIYHNAEKCNNEINVNHEFHTHFQINSSFLKAHHEHITSENVIHFVKFGFSKCQNDVCLFRHFNLPLNKRHRVSAFNSHISRRLLRKLITQLSIP